MPEPVPAPASPPHAPGRWGRRADTLSVGLVLAFAFVAASFVARNSDVWLHLATGRLLAGGSRGFTPTRPTGTVMTPEHLEGFTSCKPPHTTG